MLGGFEPSGAILLVDVAAPLQFLDGLAHFAAVIQAVLVEPHVEAHAEVLHGLANLVEHHRHGTFAELLAHLAIAFAQRLALLVQALIGVLQGGQVHAITFGLFGHAGRDFVDIRAFVAVARRFDAIAFLPQASSGRPRGDE